MKEESTESIIKDIKRKTRRKFSSEDKVRIVLEGFRGEVNVAELCRKEGIQQTQYYKWSKDFMEAGKKRMSGDTERDANTSEVKDLKKQNDSLKGLVADLSLKVQVLKKSLKGLE